jgi:NADH-quinone oxidoreductase subunit G
MSIMDEIQRLVPGYDISRVSLLSGSEQQTKLVHIDGAHIPSHPELVLPSNDTLFTSGTLGRYSRVLNSVVERETDRAEVAAD